jgi:hypothetical protein
MKTLKIKIDDPDHFLRQNFRIDKEGNMLIQINEGDKPLRPPVFSYIEDEKESK